MQQFNTTLIVTISFAMSLVFNTSANAKILYFDLSSSSDMTIPKTDKAIKNIYAIKNDDVEQIIEYYAHKYHIQPELLKAIIQQESNFNALAVSPRGAKGLMQVMPATASAYGKYNLLIPKQNIEVGTRHISYLLKRYDKLPIALAAYNAGEGNVDKYRGIPPFSETQNYVLKVLQSYNEKLDNKLLTLGQYDKGPLQNEASPTVKILAVNKKIQDSSDKKIVNNSSANKKKKTLYFSMRD